jgi:methylmalonyl-CoA mutase cobalamin-binding subunit
MVYGNTTIYGEGAGANFAGLASYLLVDILAQRRRPSGHAVNAVPVTEAERIPDIDEVVEAQLFAGRLIDRAEDWQALLDPAPVEATAARILGGGRAFRDRALDGLAEAGIDTANPFEMLLALRRIGPRRLETLFGQGEPDAERPGGRRPLVEATTIGELDRLAAKTAAGLGAPARAAIAAAGFKACTATSDVHEFGKILLDGTLRRLGVGLLDAGVSSDPETVARAAKAGRADFIAVSTYNGVALDYLTGLKGALAALGLELPVFIGGRLNQMPASSNTNLPVDVGAELTAAGAIVCRRVEDMLERLAELAERRPPRA